MMAFFYGLTKLYTVFGYFHILCTHVCDKLLYVGVQKKMCVYLNSEGPELVKGQSKRVYA